MDRQQRFDALDLALGNEESERKFYLENAQRTKNPLGRAMFLEIAADELEHYERLKELGERWKKDQKWPETVPLGVKMTDVRKILDSYTGSEDAKEGDADDIRAVETAISFEARGMEFYAGLRDSVVDEKEKAFFALLAKMEREHYLSLKDVEEYLKDPVSWLSRTERHTLDGA
jgi:rubrerythrin